jgi:hypothetical protein
MILDWRSFSRRLEIKNLPMNEQLRKFNEETKRLTELNWFIDTQIAIGGSKPGAAAPGFTGQVIDGPISAATVTATSAAGLALGTATTNALGVFTFADVLPVGTTFTAAGGTDSITGVSYTGNMHAEISTDIGIGKSVTISPITTFAKYLKDERSITYDQAVIELFASSSEYFGQSLDYANRETILQKDFNAEALNGETEAVAALAVASFMEGACEIMSAYEEGEGGASTTKKDAAYLAMAKQMASFTSSINLSACLEDVASDNAGESLVASKRSRTNTLLSNFKTDVFAVMDEQDKAPNYLVTKLNVLNRSGKKFAETEVLSIKAASQEEDVDNISVTVATKFNAESGSIAQIEEGVANKTVAEAAGSYTPHVLRWMSFGPVSTMLYSGNVTGTFHTVDDEIGVGTILYANSDTPAEQGAVATSVDSTWTSGNLNIYEQLQIGTPAGTMLDHLHSNAYGILGENDTTLSNGRPASKKFYKIQSKSSGSNTIWRVNEVYEGNPNLEPEQAENAQMYTPVTQSYEFPPMDITLISGSTATKGFKIITQFAIEGGEEEGEGQPEISFGLHNVKFYYTGSAGTHWISGSRDISPNNVRIKSNTHPDVYLQYDRAGNYNVYHKQRILFKNPSVGLYNSLYNNAVEKPWNVGAANQKWVRVEESNTFSPTGGAIAQFTPASMEFEDCILQFSGSNLAEGIS